MGPASVFATLIWYIGLSILSSWLPFYLLLIMVCKSSWTVMPIKWVATPTVTSAATNSNNGLDQPNLVQIAPS